MSEDSSGKDKLVKKGWGIPGALFLGLGAYFLPALIVPIFGPGIQLLPFSLNVVSFVYFLLFELMVVGAIFLFVKLYGQKLSQLGLVKFKFANLGLVVLGFIVYLAASVAISTIFGMLVNYDPNQAQDVGFNDPVGLELFLVFISLVVLAPLAEELLFRGFIFQGLRRRLHFWPCAIFVSLLFALVHGQINVGLDVFALSLVLCWLREQTGSLWPSIILHAAKNGLAFLLLFVFKVL